MTPASIARQACLTVIAAACAALPGARPCRALSEKPETVMVTLRPKAGAEGRLAEVIARHWRLIRGLALVTDAPHLTLRANEEDRPYFVEVFTWRDASTPDNAPEAVQAIWSEMRQLVESRGGRSGLEIVPVEQVTPPADAAH